MTLATKTGAISIAMTSRTKGNALLASHLPALPLLRPDTQLIHQIILCIYFQPSNAWIVPYLMELDVLQTCQLVCASMKSREKE